LEKLGALVVRQPIRVDLIEGKTYFWCECGRSEKQPFCDGSHTGTPYSAKEFVAVKTESRFLCACKDTQNAPFCDGEHSR
jgi:CDGSH-type Zn-finger protein